MKAPSIDEIVQTTLKNRMPGMIESVTRMNPLLYGDSRKYSRWELFVMRWQRRVERGRDAWLVLIGQAHIGDW